MHTAETNQRAAGGKVSGEGSKTAGLLDDLIRRARPDTEYKPFKKYTRIFKEYQEFTFFIRITSLRPQENILMKYRIAEEGLVPVDSFPESGVSIPAADFERVALASDPEEEMLRVSRLGRAKAYGDWPIEMLDLFRTLVVNYSERRKGARSLG